MSKVLQKYAQNRPRDEEDDEPLSLTSNGKKTGPKSTTKTTTTTTALKPSQEALALTPAAQKQKGKKGSDSSKNKSSIIYVGHIPNGFYESEMRKFFRQFGGVKRIRLFRSKKTNNSKGYAFVEFATPDVASTVAQSMNGYFLMERKLVAEVVPLDKHHSLMFAKYKFRKSADSDSDNDSESGNESKDKESGVEKVLSAEQQAALVGKAAGVLTKKMNKLAAMGIDFQLPTVLGKKRSSASLTVVAAEEDNVAAASIKSNKKAKPSTSEVAVVTETVAAVQKNSNNNNKNNNNKKNNAEKKEKEVAEEVPVVAATKATARPSKIAKLSKK
jgi:nucleolar protein 15